MASEPDSAAVGDDTIAADPSDLAPPEETTNADGDWPVAESYYVEPDAADPARLDETGADETVVVTQAAQAPRRRFPPDVGPGVLLAILGAVAVLVVGAVLLGLDRGDGDGAATPPTPTQEEAPTTTPVETSPPPQAPAEIAVADVEGMALAEATAALQEQGLRFRVSRSPSKRPPGEILSQSPPAGAEIARRSVVALVVAGATETPASPGRIEVPDVVGLSASRAVSAIRDAGLRARIQLVPSTEPSGTVVGQSPSEGAEVAEDATIRLEVARARPVVKLIEVPDVVGSSAAEARGELRAVGLKVSTTTVGSQEPAGVVIAQSPAASVSLREGATVKLTVSAGPAKVGVPDVTGLDDASATLELERAGFQVRVLDEPTTRVEEDGVVLRQTPQGGSSASEGATVTITVARVG